MATNKNDQSSEPIDHDEAMMNPFDPKFQSIPQQKYMEESYYKINISTGPVQCGKSHITNLRFCYYTIFESPHKRFMITGNTIKTVHSNVIDNGLLEMYKMMNCKVEYSFGDYLKFWTPDGEEKIIWIVGVNNKDATNKLKGKVVGGTLADEITTYPKDPGLMVIARNSLKGAKVFATTNPSSKNHWVWEEFIGNDKVQKVGQCRVFWFKFEDNPTWTEEQKEFYMNSFQGVFFRRNILGEWVAAEGAIYDKFDDEIGRNIFIETPFGKNYDDYYVCADFGTGSVTTFALWGVKYNEIGDNDFHCLKEYYWDSQREGEQKTTLELVQDLWDFIKDYHGRIRAYFVDPSATPLKAEMIKFEVDEGNYVLFPFQNKVVNAYNDVNEGIGRLQVLIANNHMRWHESCTDAIREFQSYVWDENFRIRGESKPVKKDDHCPDRDRYGIMTYERYYVKKKYIKHGRFMAVSAGQRVLIKNH